MEEWGGGIEELEEGSIGMGMKRECIWGVGRKGIALEDLD